MSEDGQTYLAERKAAVNIFCSVFPDDLRDYCRRNGDLQDYEYSKPDAGNPQHRFHYSSQQLSVL